ncbi:DUF502 domain-containing protein [Opitutus terrae]|uniref:DUF502 domain-containing protein n=1 Tax=Opitutus terrae (strain DSM 11246 / JCM 15787 / PB90-1) TaxID=452637 RepID=B1ZT10_OPITP|nr:DUF502 domain-containing protein [Opitutus terrae]ACB75799.1 protein of unknown function DUF502 [Opitutus terrae PB90-1]
MSDRSTSKIVTFRTAFFSGLLLLAPLVVTVWAFSKIIDLVGGTFRPLYEHYLPNSLQRIPFFWDLLATIAVLLLVTILGYLSNYVFGKFFLSVIERFIRRIPGIGTVYNSVKQIVATFGTQNKNLFNKVVLVQFPREGLWSIGFLTNKQQAEPQANLGREAWTVFVPTTPNPTSGFLIIVPREHVVELEMSVGDGMKLIISGGAVVPPWPAPVPALPAK